jgi:ABC-type Fe3+-siderophore transport system permease subunit
MLPIWAICAKFPIWTEQSGASRSAGAGLILIGMVIIIVFRKTVFDFIKDKLNIKHAPPLVIWLVLIVISYTFVYIGNALRDMNTVFWMGFIGCAIGTGLTYIAESCFGKKADDERA